MARPRRPRLLPATALFVLVLVALSGWIGVRGLLAQRELVAARAELTTARTALLDRDVEAARTALADAGDRTGRARALTADPLWRLAAAVPFYGDTATTARGVAAAADDLARTVLPMALSGAERLDPTLLRRPDGAVDLEVLRAATPPVVDSADLLVQVQSDLEDLPEAEVAAPVVRARDELLAQVDELADAVDGAAAALQVAPALLGEDRPRRYLLLVQQYGESRGTGGLFGGFVELVADGGRVSVASTGSNRDLTNGTIPVPDGVPADFVDRYERLGAFRIWQNANLSPDLPVVAKVVQARWQAQGGQPLDAVVVIDPTGLASLLAGTGPIELPDGGRVTPAQLPQYLAVDQYAGVPLDREGQLARKDQLEDVAAAVAGRLTTGGGDAEQLLRGVTEAVRSGHLRITSEDPALAPVLQAQGVDGGLPAGPAPVVYPVVYNDSEGKLDSFLERSVSYAGQGCDDEQRRTTVTVVLTNTAPAVEALPEYLTIRREPGRRIASNVNRTTLSLYGTRGAQLVEARADGAGDVLVTAGDEGGLPVWSLVLDLPPGEPRAVVFELLEPTVEGTPRIPRQPLALPLDVEVTLPTC